MCLQSGCTFLRRVAVLLSLAGSAGVAVLQAQPTTLPGARFGEVIALGGAPSDVVVDESRQRLYAVNSGSNRVIVYDYDGRRVVNYISVGTYPSAAAMSMDSRYLYVTNVQSASLSVIDLDNARVMQTVSLPARPEGVEVGFDGRVLITTQGTGTNNQLNTLLLYDGSQEALQQLTPVPSPPPISTPVPLPQVFVGRPSTPFPGRLMRIPDGQFIIGMVAINQTANNAQTTLFVYEAASGTVLRNRTVTGQSTILSMAADGSRFMAGSTLYDTATLSVIGQLSTTNAPFIFTNFFSNPAISTLRAFGGSVFTPAGNSLYGTFNFGGNNTADRVRSDVLFVCDPRNLGIKLGIRLPENLSGRMVMTSSGAHAWATSDSGLIYLPLGRLYEYPILEPESRAVFLALDPCNKGLAKASVRVHNLGVGKLTFSVPNVTTALVANVESGVVPSTITFIMEPGRTGVNRRPGTNFFTGAGSGNGSGINVNLASLEAINFPSSIRVFMNYREPDQRGLIFPVPTTVSGGEADGMQELILDEPRNRVYISNAGYNRVEVFDTVRQKFLEPITVGQLPRSMAASLDGRTLYVGNSGGESISIVDLDTRKQIGQVEFPPIPRAGNQNAIRPLALAYGLSGLQFVMSNGGVWRVIGSQATPRPASPVISLNPSVSVLPSPAQYSMAGTPDGELLVALAGNGTAYLYDAIADAFTTSSVVNTNPIQSYYGPAAAAADGSFFLLNGLILSPALAVIGGAERPGTIQIQPPPGQGQPPQTTIVSAGQRHVAAVHPLNDTSFVRLTLPVRQNAASVTRDDPRPVIEMVDIRSGSESVVAVAPENPPRIVFGTGRLSTPARQIAVDSKGTAYFIGLTGLNVVPLTLGSRFNPPQIAGGSRGIVNAIDGSPNFGPGSFITVSGLNLATAATAESTPLPTVLGGSCVTFSDIPLPLLQTSDGQISGQVPDTLRPGLYLGQVRSLLAALQSDPVVIRVQSPQ